MSKLDYKQKSQLLEAVAGNVSLEKIEVYEEMCNRMIKENSNRKINERKSFKNIIPQNTKIINESKKEEIVSEELESFFKDILKKSGQ